MEKLDHSYINGRNVEWYTHSVKEFGSFLKKNKLTLQLSYNLTIALFGIYPTEMKTYVHTKTCIQMFITALFLIARKWKQHRCPSMGEWLNRVVYLHQEYYLAIKRNELLITHKDLDESPKNYDE